MRSALVFSLLCSSLYGAVVGGAININSGYRFDSITLKGERIGVARKEKLTEFKGWQNSLDATLKWGGFFLRASAAYEKLFKNPEFYTELAGIKEPTQFLKKRYGYSGLCAFGYLFSLSDGVFFLGPEAGYAFQRMNTDQNAHEIAATPFMGFQFLWRAICDWSVGLNFDFHFLGQRRSRIVDEAVLPFEATSKGTYYGPEARLTFDYSITDHWSMGVTSFFKYIKTSKCNLPSGYNNSTQTWMNGGASLTFGYTF